MPPPVKKSTVRTQQLERHTPWAGPEVDGVTQSMLWRFLGCRERFRLLVVEGLRPAQQFSHQIEYGQMWHVCEEAHSAATRMGNRIVGTSNWVEPLKQYVHELSRRYPSAIDQIDKWYNVCKIQFPIYQQYWAKQIDNETRVPVCQEKVFNVPFQLPSGRCVRLRGKMDAVDVVGSKSSAALYLQENKTKSDPNEELIKRQLTFDLQTMMYLTALQTMQRTPDLWSQHQMPANARNLPIGGVRYNVIRRPLSGGRGTIVQHKPTKKNPTGETKEQYYARLKSIIDGTGKNRKDEDTPGPSYFFMRWRAEVPMGDLLRFQKRTLIPLLEDLCNWWDFVSTGDPWRNEALNFGTHWQHPFGGRNILDEGGSTDLDEYLITGSTVGLERVDTLFSELH